MSVRERLESLGITLPAPTNPAANYANTVLTGNLLFVAGKGPLPFDGQLPKGKLGREYSADEGYAFARSAGLDILAAVNQALGDLDRVARVVKLQGFVNATPDFVDHTAVIDGASDVFVQVFGDRGTHARLAVGVPSLPAGLAVEVEATLAVRA